MPSGGVKDPKDCHTLLPTVILTQQTILPSVVSIRTGTIGVKPSGQTGQ